MSDTPRTDALEATFGPILLRQCVEMALELARHLEHELASANRSCDACVEEIDKLRAELNAFYTHPEEVSTLRKVRTAFAAMPADASWTRDQILRAIDAVSEQLPQK